MPMVPLICDVEAFRREGIDQALELPTDPMLRRLFLLTGRICCRPRCIRPQQLTTKATFPQADSLRLPSKAAPEEGACQLERFVEIARAEG